MNVVSLFLYSSRTEDAQLLGEYTVAVTGVFPPRAKEDVPKDIPVDEDLRKVMDVKEVHAANAEVPIVVTELGMVTDVSDVHT